MKNVKKKNYMFKNIANEIVEQGKQKLLETDFSSFDLKDKLEFYQGIHEQIAYVKQLQFNSSANLQALSTINDHKNSVLALALLAYEKLHDYIQPDEFEHFKNLEQDIFDLLQLTSNISSKELDFYRNRVSLTLFLVQSKKLSSQEEHLRAFVDRILQEINLFKQSNSALTKEQLTLSRERASHLVGSDVNLIDNKALIKDIYLAILSTTLWVRENCVGDSAKIQLWNQNDKTVKLLNAILDRARGLLDTDDLYIIYLVCLDLPLPPMQIVLYFLTHYQGENKYRFGFDLLSKYNEDSNSLKTDFSPINRFILDALANQAITFNELHLIYLLFRQNPQKLSQDFFVNLSLEHLPVCELEEHQLQDLFHFFTYSQQNNVLSQLNYLLRNYKSKINDQNGAFILLYVISILSNANNLDYEVVNTYLALIPETLRFHLISNINTYKKSVRILKKLPLTTVEEFIQLFDLIQIYFNQDKELINLIIQRYIPLYNSESLLTLSQEDQIKWHQCRAQCEALLTLRKSINTFGLIHSDLKSYIEEIFEQDNNPHLLPTDKLEIFDNVCHKFQTFKNSIQQKGLSNEKIQTYYKKLVEIYQNTLSYQSEEAEFLSLLEALQQEKLTRDCHLANSPDTLRILNSNQQEEIKKLYTTLESYSDDTYEIIFLKSKALYALERYYATREKIELFLNNHEINLAPQEKLNLYCILIPCLIKLSCWQKAMHTTETCKTLVKAQTDEEAHLLYWKAMCYLQDKTTADIALKTLTALPQNFPKLESSFRQEIEWLKFKGYIQLNYPEKIRRQLQILFNLTLTDKDYYALIKICEKNQTNLNIIANLLLKMHDKFPQSVRTKRLFIHCIEKINNQDLWPQRHIALYKSFVQEIDNKHKTNPIYCLTKVYLLIVVQKKHTEALELCLFYEEKWGKNFYTSRNIAQLKVKLLLREKSYQQALDELTNTKNFFYHKDYLLFTSLCDLHISGPAKAFPKFKELVCTFPEFAYGYHSARNALISLKFFNYARNLEVLKNKHGQETSICFNDLEEEFNEFCSDISNIGDSDESKIAPETVVSFLPSSATPTKIPNKFGLFPTEFALPKIPNLEVSTCYDISSNHLLHDIAASFKVIPNDCEFYFVGWYLFSFIENSVPIDDIDMVLFTKNFGIHLVESLEKNEFMKTKMPNLYKKVSNLTNHSIDLYIPSLKEQRKDHSFISEDYSNRDFTVACLYGKYNSQNLSLDIIDPSNKGLSDFNDKILRTVASVSCAGPQTALQADITVLQEDPIRVLRALKYILRGFTPTSSLSLALKDCVLDLDHSDFARKHFYIYAKKLYENSGQAFIQSLIDHGVFNKIFPDLTVASAIDNDFLRKCITSLQLHISSTESRVSSMNLK